MRQLQPLSEADLDARLAQLVHARGAAATQPPSIPEVFALAAEVCRRGMDWDEYYAHQLETGLALLAGRFVELPNGDGKTAAAVPPFVYRVLRGGRGYLFTANPFLAARDAGNYGLVYHRLGLSVGVAASWGSYLFNPAAALFWREFRRALAQVLGVNYTALDIADLSERVEEVVQEAAFDHVARRGVPGPPRAGHRGAPPRGLVPRRRRGRSPRKDKLPRGRLRIS